MKQSPAKEKSAPQKPGRAAGVDAAYKGTEPHSPPITGPGGVVQAGSYMKKKHG